MKKLLAALALSAAFAAPAAAVPVVIDFEGYAEGASIAAGSTAATGLSIDQSLSILATPQLGMGPIGNKTAYTGAFTAISGSFVGAFAGGVTSLSIFAGDWCCDLDSVTLRGFDAANNLVGSASFTGTSAQVLTITGPGIVRFDTLTSGAVVFDNITFDGTPVSTPEPAALGLLGLGILGVAATRRRKAG